jgi:hypothetical protein
VTLPSPCPGGSQVRPGFASNQQLDSVQIEAAIILAGAAPEVAALVAVALATETWAIQQMCAAPPPAQPLITAADLDDLKQPLNFAAWTAAVAKFRDWFVSWYWPQVCQCIGTTTPPSPPLVGPPSTGSNAGLPAANQIPPCFTSSTGLWSVSPPFGTQTYTDISSLLPGSFDTPVIPPSVGQSSQAKSLPGDLVYCELDVTAAGGGAGPAVVIYFFNSTGNVVLGGIRGLDFGNSAPGASLSTGPIFTPGGAVAWFIVVVNYPQGQVPGQTDWSVGGTFRYYCNANPNTPRVDCCPPDPLVDQKLNLVINLLRTLPTSGGGTSPPTSWTDGIRHGNLSGSGSVLLSPQATGVRAEVVTFPLGQRVQPGQPDFYWELGFITPSVLGSPLRGQRLVFAPQSFALPQFTDTVEWTLPAGAVVDLVELLPV